MNKKNFVVYILVLLILGSCSNIGNEGNINENINKETTIMMNNSMNNIANKSKMSGIMNTMKLKQKYITPVGPYNLDLEITLKSGKISKLNVFIENPSEVVSQYLTLFKAGINSEIIGKTLKEVTEIDIVSGASLTTRAFISAIKNKS